MVARQVITVGADGSLTTLRRKPGCGIDLRRFGPMEMNRVSDIEWDVRRQGFIIGIRDDGVGGTRYPLTAERWYRIATELPSGAFVLAGITGVDNGDLVTDLYFHEYEDAVAAEVYYLDSLRLGVTAPAESRRGSGLPRRLLLQD